MSWSTTGGSHFLASNPLLYTQNPQTFLNAITTMLASLTAPASGSIPYEYIYPGTDFAPGGVGSITDAQFLWDSAWSAIIAGNRGIGTRAQNWLKNWVSTQQGGGASTLGMFPNYIRPGGAHGVDKSQPPVIAYATYNLYLKTLDTTFLSFMYAALKANYTWWTTNRDDTTASYAGTPQSNLASWGSTVAAGSLDGATFKASRESGLDPIESGGQDPDRLYVSCDTDPGKLDYCVPDLNCYLIMEADSISKIATVLGFAADATTYAGYRDNRRAAMNAVMWDDEQGCYQFTTRQDIGSLGGQPTTNGATAVGATSIVINASGLTVALNPGAKLLFANGVTVQIGPAGQKIGDTTLNLLNPVSATIPTTTGFIIRWFSYVKSLANLTLPLWAGVPNSYQAETIVNEHLIKMLTGTEPETYSVFFGTGYMSGGAGSVKRNRLIKFNHYAMRGPLSTYVTQVAGLTGASDGVTVNGAGSQLVFPLSKASLGPALRHPRTSDGVAGIAGTLFWPYAFYSRSLEQSSVSGPTQIAVTYDPPTAGNANDYPEILLRTALMAYSGNNAADYRGGATVLDTILSGGSAGVAKTDTLTEPAPYGTIPFAVTLRQPAANTHSFKLRRLDVTTYPRGFLYLSPYGLILTPRLHDLAVPINESEDPHSGVAEGNQPDYCNGAHFLMIEYLAVQGLLAYGMYEVAQDIARRVIKRVYNEWLRTNTFWEYYGMRGTGRGSRNYEWTGLVGNLIDQFGFTGQ